MNHPLHFGICALAAASLACSVFVGGPAFPDPPVPNSPEALQALQAELERARVESMAGGTLRLQLTQEQLTAYVASRLSLQHQPVITGPQVVLGEQEMVVYGRAQSWIFEANVSVTAVFSSDDLGRPQISVTNAELGPMPMPQWLRDGIAAAMNEALTGYIGPAAIGFRLDSIGISGGVMTVTGRLQ